MDRKGFYQMNDQVLEKKVRQDTAKVSKDINTLVGDRAVQFGRFEENMNQAVVKAKDDLSNWVDDGVTQLSQGYEKMSGDARDAVGIAAATMKKDVEQGLEQYEAKAHELAGKVPGGFGEMASQHPWISISMALVVGFLLGRLLRPASQALG
jgi:ElaB/YqjD/DUF883 family membrane-anchored ribosome-binding protein